MAVRFDFSPEKAIAAVCHFASAHLPGLTKGKLCKLIFLADRLHVLRYGWPITGDDLCAMEHGPVPSKTLNLLNAFIAGAGGPGLDEMSEFIRLDRRFSNPHFEGTGEPNLDLFSHSDLNVLGEVIQEHGQKTFNELRRLTHDLEAYKKAWEARSSNREFMRFEDLFEDEDPDSIEGAKEEMLENASLREAFSA